MQTSLSMSPDSRTENWIIFALFLISWPPLYFPNLTIMEVYNQNCSRSTVKWKLLVLLIPACLVGLSSSIHNLY